MSSQPSKDFGEFMAMARGFQAAKMLLVATDLAVFDFLEEPRSATEAAAYLKGNERAVHIFLDGLAALGLLVKGVDYFHNGELASRYLVRGKDDYRGVILRHMHHTLRGWMRLEETVILGHPPDVDPEKWLDIKEERQEAEVRDFIWGMHALARDLAPQVAAKLDLRGVKRLLDLGGGPGTYAIYFALAQPELRATVFDLPGPIKIARENSARYRLSGRIDTLTGNFLKDDIGRGYDFIWISHILHSHDESQCHLIIDKAIQALEPGGALAIQDFYLNDDGCSPPGAAMFSVHMLAVTPKGRSYKHREVAQWLADKGLTAVAHFPSSDTIPDASIVAARK
jgi:predicted O-methyltransferase YrrM